ncbi:unnamed protein product [Linum trigynum]|uniref:Uncharacterized protein n=1 Tax=Linum trigynum TaxID=586398 RepID=A0AAV2F042_9ROSI
MYSPTNPQRRRCTETNSRLVGVSKLSSACISRFAKYLSFCRPSTNSSMYSAWSAALGVGIWGNNDYTRGGDGRREDKGGMKVRGSLSPDPHF